MPQNNLGATRSRLYNFEQLFQQLAAKKVIEQVLAKHSLNLTQSKKLADCVKRLSDFYIANPNQTTPWDKSWAQVAYFVYYFPLNLIRMATVFEELQRVDFLSGLKSLLDFGCGVSGMSALAHRFGIDSYTGVDKSSEALRLQEHLHSNWSPTAGQFQLRRTVERFDSYDFAVFSYVLTETQLPKWSEKMDALLIIEPSTRQDGRQLLDLRRQLLNKDYFVWAPCTHQYTCPLLTESTKDWCHDRIPCDMPSWYREMESFLPFKNRSLTFSYLALRKTLPPSRLRTQARIVGDRLDERGKFKQLICRGEKREFLAWLKKEHSDVPEVPRGSLVDIPKNLVSISNELRIPGDEKV